MLELIGLILLVMGAGNWLLGKMAKRPDGEFKVLALGVGLFLTISMTIGGIYFLTETDPDIGESILFFIWAGLGVLILVKAAKE